jgi:hypothetical protein
MSAQPSLPQCTLLTDLPSGVQASYAAFDKNLIQAVHKLLLGDCWAIVLDEGIVYNAYKPRSLAESVQQDMTRLHLVNYFENSVVVPVVRRQKAAVVQLYMREMRVDFVYQPEKEMWYVFSWVGAGTILPR